MKPIISTDGLYYLTSKIADFLKEQAQIQKNFEKGIMETYTSLKKGDKVFFERAKDIRENYR